MMTPITYWLHPFTPSIHTHMLFFTFLHLALCSRNNKYSMRHLFLDRVVRSAVRLIGGFHKYASISGYMPDTLHWLHIRQRIFYRVAVLEWHCLIGIAPVYLQVKWGNANKTVPLIIMVISDFNYRGV